MYSVLSCVFAVTIVLVNAQLLGRGDSDENPCSVTPDITRYTPRNSRRPKESSMSLKYLVEMIKEAESDSSAENIVLVIWNGADHFTGTLVGMEWVYMPQTLEHRLKVLRDKKQPKPKKEPKQKK